MPINYIFTEFPRSNDLELPITYIGSGNKVEERLEFQAGILESRKLVIEFGRGLFSELGSLEYM